MIIQPSFKGSPLYITGGILPHLWYFSQTKVQNITSSLLLFLHTFSSQVLRALWQQWSSLLGCLASSCWLYLPVMQYLVFSLALPNAQPVHFSWPAWSQSVEVKTQATYSYWLLVLLQAGSLTSLWSQSCWLNVKHKRPRQNPEWLKFDFGFHSMRWNTRAQMCSGRRGGWIQHVTLWGRVTDFGQKNSLNSE